MKKFILIIAAFFLTTALFARDNQGEVQIYIFTDTGLPLEGASVTVGEKTFVSDESGLLSFTDYPGTQEYMVFFGDNHISTVQLTIREGLAQEAIITVIPDGPPPENVVNGDYNDVLDTLTQGREELDESKPKGFLSGTLTHIENGEEVGGATVIFRGVVLETTTDDRGRFTVEVPAGEYSISVIHPDYSTRTIDGILIKEEDTTELEIELTPSGITLDAVTVFASTEVRVQGGTATLIEETKNSGVMLNLIGSEQMSKSGDSNAASALGRVTGLSIVGGRYVYVRGMGERYSSSYLNGARLPSPEIDRRVVPLDLFPTSVLESMAIQKTYSPDIYGDFGGGSVELRTSGIPDDRYNRRLRMIFSGSVTYNPGSTFTDQLMEEAGTLDFLGIDDGHRGEPDSLVGDQVTVSSGLTEGLPQEQVDQIGRDMNRDWDGTTGMIPLDFGGSFSIRDKIVFRNSHEFGWNISMLYKNQWDVTEESLTDYSNVENDEVNYDYDSITTNHSIDIGGLLDLEYRPKRDLSFGTTTLLVRTTDNEAQNYTGWYTDDSGYFDVTKLSWVESTLFSQRVGGEVGFGFLNGALMEWNYTFSMAKRYEPGSSDLKYFRGEFSDPNDPYGLYSRSFAVKTNFINVEDLIHDAGIQLEIPIFWFNNASADYIEVGGQIMIQDRESDVRRFIYGKSSDVNQNDPFLFQDPDVIFADENIGDEIDFSEQTESTDNYIGRHRIYAGYFNTDIILWADIRMNLGARFEYSEQSVETYDLFGSDTANAVLVDFDVLPAVNFTIPIQDRMQVRLGGSRTVNRPDLRELSAAPKFGIEGSGQFNGNPDLQRAEIYSADLRWEYYITEMENLSVGVFYKYFINAIEVVNGAGPGSPSTLQNVPVAFNVGAELSWWLSFRYLSDAMRNMIMKTQPSPGMRRFVGGVAGVFRDMYCAGNVSFIYSEIDYQGKQGINTNETRPLQGQSPWIINASLGYRNSVSWSQDRKTHTSIYLSYNVFGPRISQIGTRSGNVGIPDFYEQPFHQLDLVVKHSFNEYFSIGLKVNNILDLPAIETVGDLTVNEEKKGRSITLSAKLDL